MLTMNLIFMQLYSCRNIVLWGNFFWDTLTIITLVNPKFFTECNISTASHLKNFSKNLNTLTDFKPCCWSCIGAGSMLVCPELLDCRAWIVCNGTACCGMIVMVPGFTVTDDTLVCVTCKYMYSETTFDGCFLLIVTMFFIDSFIKKKLGKKPQSKWNFFLKHSPTVEAMFKTKVIYHTYKSDPMV